MASRAQLTGTHTCLIERTLIFLVQVVVLVLNRFDPDHWELNNCDLGVGVFNTLLVVVPLRALHEHSVNIDTNFRFFLYLLHS
jgi:hypothetical protein